MAETLIPVLAFLFVACIGSAVLFGRAGRKGEVRARLRESLNAGPAPSEAKGAKPKLLTQLGHVGTRLSPGKITPRLKEDLAKAGYHGHNAAGVYLGAKMVLLILGLVAAWVPSLLFNMQFTTKALLIAVASIGCFFIPNLVVHLRRKRRCEEVRRHLPDALDLLEICVSSGMGLDAAWNAVTEEVRGVSPTLADEMALTSLEIHLGAKRAEAMRHLAERTAAEDLSSLVAILVQSERFGTSIAEALQTFAASMREMRSEHAREIGEKAAVKLLIPMIFFIFPAILIVLLGPAAITISKTFAATK